MTRLLAPVLALAATLLVGACSGGGDDADPPAPTTTSAAPSESPTTAATPPPRPRNHACYRLTYAAAVAPTSSGDPVSCGSRHTATTFEVGDLDTVVDGHLLAVDSRRVRDAVATTCPAQLAAFVGGTQKDRQLSMLRSVWFTPTVEESDAGASWYRCDIVALAGSDKLADLTGRMAGALDREDQRDHYAMCGTAEPGTAGFERVICSAQHSWRAVDTVPFDGDRYPGVEKVGAAGEEPCQDAGAAAAGGALDYRWGYEWPTAAQWSGGQHYGICWVPSEP